MAEDSLIRILMDREPSTGQGKPDAAQIGQAKEAQGMKNAMLKSEAATSSGWSKAGKFMRKNLGISFTTSAILKQSQIFTSMIGTVFQLLGALVDVILAPFVPVLIPLIRFIGDMIPKIHEYMQNTVAPKIVSLLQTMSDMYKWGKTFWDANWGVRIKMLWEGAPKLTDLVWEGVTAALPDWMVRGAVPLFFTDFDFMLRTVKNAALFILLMPLRIGRWFLNHIIPNIKIGDMLQNAIKRVLGMLGDTWIGKKMGFDKFADEAAKAAKEAGETATGAKGPVDATVKALLKKYPSLGPLIGQTGPRLLSRTTTGGAAGGWSFHDAYKAEQEIGSGTALLHTIKGLGLAYLGLSGKIKDPYSATAVGGFDVVSADWINKWGREADRRNVAGTGNLWTRFLAQPEGDRPITKVLLDINMTSQDALGIISQQHLQAQNSVNPLQSFFLNMSAGQMTGALIDPWN